MDAFSNGWISQVLAFLLPIPCHFLVSPYQLLIPTPEAHCHPHAKDALLSGPTNPDPALTKGSSPCCSPLGVLAGAVLCKRAFGHSRSQDHRHHLPTPGHPGWDLCWVSLPTLLSVACVCWFLSTCLSRGVPGSTEPRAGTACAPMYPVSDLSILVWARATPRNHWAGKLHQGGCWYPRF